MGNVTRPYHLPIARRPDDYDGHDAAGIPAVCGDNTTRETLKAQISNGRLPTDGVYQYEVFIVGNGQRKSPFIYRPEDLDDD